MTKRKLTDSDDTDYLESFIGKELLPDVKESLNTKGFLDVEDDLTPEDKEDFESYIKDGDKIELVAKKGIDKIKVFITNIVMVTIKKNEHYHVKYTLVRK